MPGCPRRTSGSTSASRPRRCPSSCPADCSQGDRARRPLCELVERILAMVLLAPGRECVACVAQYDAPEGGEVEADVEGVHTLPKAAGQAIAFGARVYFAAGSDDATANVRLAPLA